MGRRFNIFLKEEEVHTMGTEKVKDFTIRFSKKDALMNVSEYSRINRKKHFV